MAERLIIVTLALLLASHCSSHPVNGETSRAKILKSHIDDDAARFFAAARELNTVATTVLTAAESSPSYVEHITRVYEAMSDLNDQRAPDKELWLRHIAAVDLQQSKILNEMVGSARVVLESLNSPASLYDLTWKATATGAHVPGSVAMTPVDDTRAATSVAEAMQVKRAGILRDGVHVTDDSGGNVFFNGSNGINQLIAMCEETPCKKNLFTRMCERGTVQMDAWMLETLKTQRKAMGSLHVPDALFYGTHNSYNDKADMYGLGDWTLNLLMEIASKNKWSFVWAQQAFTMTDQLAMGVRMVDLNPVWFSGKMRLCHCGTEFKVVDDVIELVEKALNRTFNFTSKDLGCSPFDRTFDSGLAELLQFIERPDNANDVFLIRINDKGPFADWGRIAMIQDSIEKAFGDLLYRPIDRPDSATWHTIGELSKMGRRVIAFGDRIANGAIHDMSLRPHYPLNDMTYYTPYPKCGAVKPGNFSMFGGESQVVGPVYDGPADDGLIVRENIKDMVDCGLTVPEMDLASPTLIRAGLWAWAEGHPTAAATSLGNEENETLCAALAIGGEQPTTISGRWYVLECTALLPHACREADTGHWTVSAVPGTHAAGVDSCASLAPEATFGHPRTGFENRRLRDIAVSTGAGSFVWINFSVE
eukprot:Opistho-2@57458